MKMNWPNRLTILRMILVPVFMALMLTGHSVIALIVFIVASLTDSLDGYLARKNNEVTVFGKFMDPLADKLLVTSALIIFVEYGQMASWIAVIVLARELAVSSLRILAAANGIIMQAGWSGKIKTASTCVGLCVMMVPEIAFFELFGGIFVNDICVWVILLTTVVSGVDYFWNNRGVFKSAE